MLEGSRKHLCDWIRLMLNAAFISQVMLGDAANYIPAKKMKAIEDAALASCDAVDGLKDVTYDAAPSSSEKACVLAMAQASVT